MNKLYFKAIIIWLLLLFTAKELAAQTASAYTCTALTGTYSYLSGGTTVPALSDDEKVSGSIPIGFTFNYCNRDYNSLIASSNGWLSFNTLVSSTVASNTRLNLATIKPALFPLWDDLSGKSGSFSYLSSGVAPNRTCTLEYRDWRWNYNATAAVISFQVVLFEGTNVIKYIYKGESGSVRSGSASIGIADSAATPNYLSLNNTSATATASATVFTTSINTKPADNQVFQFTPPPPCITPAPGATLTSATTICTGNSVNLSLSSPTPGIIVTYQWQSSTDSIIFTDIAGATAETYTATPAATLFYRCRVTCSVGSVTVASDPVKISFFNNVLSTTGATRCGTGTVNLSATSNPGSTLKWYAVASGDTALGSGTTFTTPTIAASRDFYVAAETRNTDTVRIGTGGTNLSSSGLSPFAQNWESSHSQYLLLASELQASGLGAGAISALSFFVSTKSSSRPFSSYTIKIAKSTATSLTGLLSPSFTTVYGPVDYSSVAGANNFTFGSSFTWDGVSNLLIDVCFDNDPAAAGAFYTSNDAVQATTKSYTAVAGMYKDDGVLCGATTGGTAVSGSVLPVILLNGIKVCAGPRVAVTATVNVPPAFGITDNHSVCNNAISQLQVTAGAGSFGTFTWSPVTNLYTDAGATTPYVAGSSATTVYFKGTTTGNSSIVGIANNTTTLCSATDTVVINNLPLSIDVVAKPSPICVSGAAKLTITTAAALDNVRYQWQSSADNSTFIDSAGADKAVLQTAVLSATRYYRLLIKNSAGATCITSNADTAKVNDPKVVSTGPAARCGPGVVTLRVVTADGTPNWYTSASGGMSIASGTDYVTPYLSTTTTYYVVSEASKPQPYTIGAGGSTLGGSSSGSSLTPFSQYYEAQHSQYLITAADLTAAGLEPGDLRSLSFNVSTKNSTLAYSNYTIKLAATTASTLSGLLSPSFTTVYGPASYTTVAGANKLLFSSHYTWDGSSNLLVDVCFENDPTGSGTFYSSNDIVSATTKSYTATYGHYADNAALCGAATGFTESSTLLPVMTFEQGGCQSARTPVTATINDNPVAGITPAGPLHICDGFKATLTGSGGDNYQWRNEAGPISGATAATYHAAVTGKYKVVVSTAASGCSDSSAAVEVIVTPVPSVAISPNGPVDVCADSTLLITSTYSGAGLRFQWYRDTVLIPGATADTLLTDTAGAYTLRVHIDACADTSEVAEVAVNPLPEAGIRLTSSNTAICPGAQVELTANPVPSGYTYQWHLDGLAVSGATSGSYLAGTPGIYTVVVRDTRGCLGQSNQEHVQLTPSPRPVVRPADLKFCAGNSLILFSNAGPHATDFSWERNDVLLPVATANLVVSEGGLYHVTVKDSFNCTQTSEKVSVTVFEAPLKPVIDRVGNVLSTGSYYTYQWYRNGKPIPGADNRRYTMLFDGDYQVQVTSADGCIAVSDTLTVVSVGITDPGAGTTIQVYPNPSDHWVTIQTPVPVDLLIKDIRGKLVRTVKHAERIDISQLADGVYLFFLMDQNGRLLQVERLLKSGSQP